MNAKQKRLKDSILSYGKRIKFRKNTFFTPDKKAHEFLFKNPLAFLIGVISDYGMPASRVWELPYNLKNRLNAQKIKFTAQAIAKIKDSEFAKIFTREPNLHRFPNTTALYIKKACIIVIQNYNGKAENIWNNRPDSNELKDRLYQFKGIGQKKANMAVKMLIKDFRNKISDKQEIDIAADIHIKRVFLRTGLVTDDNPELIIKKARQLSPEYPAALDDPVWVIGTKWCRPQNPKCSLCPINSNCLKII